MALIFVLIAAFFAATVNFCLRKNFEFQKSAQGYLCLYFICSFLISFVLRLDLHFNSFSILMGSIGVIAGVLNLIMMLLIAYALQIGPSGLTFAFQNSASMFPAFFLFFLFGAPFGFYLRWPLMIGFICLVTGLFLSLLQEKHFASSLQDASHFGKWLGVAIAIFLVQGLILSIFQWRSLLLEGQKIHVLIPWTCSVHEDMWFMPGFFLVPALVQSIRFYLSERRRFFYKEFFLGTAGGVFNGGATFCLLMATRDPSPTLRPILFPIFAVSVILLCNLWGKKFYQERIDWKGVILCLAGVLIGSLWS